LQHVFGEVVSAQDLAQQRGGPPGFSGCFEDGGVFEDRLAPVGLQLLALADQPVLVAGAVVGQYPAQQLPFVEVDRPLPGAATDRLAEGADVGVDLPAHPLPLHLEPGSPRLPGSRRRAAG
jgi:hypothetical protein